MGLMRHSFLLWLVGVHCILLLGMFDVYFKSPIVSELPPVAATFKTPAKRLVLFIGDGLRVDHVHHTCNVPYLRYMVDSGKALMGISHTRVPTESRPGTVAIAAGVYEDPSAVFKGWQANPVPVDSFFNRCRQSFAWGSPDIVHLFSQNAKNIDARSYNEEDQSFDPEESLKLNQWVFDQFSSFLKDCSQNKTCKAIVERDKISFFFHYIGIDMAGHKSKPFSMSYKRNIQLVDHLVQQTVDLLDEFFGDQKTAFVFTSDHGMTSWGSHGAGSEVETKTPLIAWGAGVKTGFVPFMVEEYEFNENVSSDCAWKVELNDKYDVEQADIAVLMSTLVGVDIPTNNMGTLPWKYIDFEKETLNNALILNLHQLLLLYHHWESITKKQLLSFFFMPFPSPDIDKIPLAHAGYAPQIVRFVDSIVKGDPEDMIKVLNDHILLIKEGINYYQTYFQSYLLVLLSSSFVGLIMIIAGKIYLCSTSPLWTLQALHRSPVLYEVFSIKFTRVDHYFAVIFGIVTIVHLCQSLPISYYVYAVLSVGLWHRAIKFWGSAAVLIQLKSLLWSQILGVSMFLTLGVGLLFLSFFYRSILSLGMGALSMFPITIRKSKNFKTGPAVVWGISCIALAIFPLLPTVGVEKQTYILTASAVLWMIIISTAVNMSHSTSIGPQIYSHLTKLQILLLNTALLPVLYVDVFANGSSDMIPDIKTYSWLTLAMNFLVLTWLPQDPSARMFNLTVTFGIPFMMLSVSFESLFFPLLTVNMASWVLLEKATAISDRRLLYNPQVVSFLHIDEVRRGFLYLFFIIFSFYGIGNIDSINSFDINWVRCFISHFSPFTMTALIILKTVLPFFLVACSLRLIIIHTRVDGVKILLISMLFCEIMNLLFLFRVKNTGSWLEIGKSISHYIIMEVSSLCLVLLYNFAGSLLTKRNTVRTLSSL